MLVRSAGVRFGLLYAGLFGISAVAMALFIWWSTAGLLNRQISQAIDEDLQNLHANFEHGGIPQLVDTIEQRLEQDVSGNAIYALSSPEGQLLQGNLDVWPPAVTPDVDTIDLKVTRVTDSVSAEVRQVLLPRGYRLLVGRDMTLVLQIANLLKGALLWCALIVTGLAVVGALTVRGLFRMQLAGVSATAVAIGAGDLARRVPTTGRGDEFDMLADTINDMLERIGRLMDGVRQVSNAIAHDLRTPITRARARLEDAARPGATEAELRGAIERAVADLDGVVRVFAALLRIAEIESGARRSAFRPLDLTPLLQGLAEFYEAGAEEKQCALVRRIAPELPAFGDLDMIQQAVANLLDNAIKFSPPGQTILLSGLLSGLVESAGLAITVADHGPGIEPADLDHATERFFRAEGARDTPGSGLGLALVQAVAVLHGGVLRLEPNHPGLRAVLMLPAAPPAAGRLPQHVEQTSSAPQPDTSLVES